MSSRALVVWGGWDGHTPRESAELFAQFLGDSDYDVTVSDSLDSYTDADLMASVDLILPVVTMSEISKEQWQGLNDAVRNGCGVAGFHGGIIDAFRQNTPYQWMTGGQWVAHPGNCIPSYEVNIVDPGHEIVRDIPDFTLTDTEQYYCHVDPGVHTLCATTFSGEHGETDLYRAGTVMPYAWTKMWGKGKVFVACWGHTYRDFDVPEAKTIVQRGLIWATR
jgi:type 1 glutamine amidotransferase